MFLAKYARFDEDEPTSRRLVVSDKRPSVLLGIAKLVSSGYCEYRRNAQGEDEILVTDKGLALIRRSR